MLREAGAGRRDKCLRCSGCPRSSFGLRVLTAVCSVSPQRRRHHEEEHRRVEEVDDQQQPASARVREGTDSAGRASSCLCSQQENGGFSGCTDFPRVEYKGLHFNFEPIPIPDIDITASLVVIMTSSSFVLFFLYVQPPNTHRCARRGAAGRGRTDGLLHLLSQPH